MDAIHYNIIGITLVWAGTLGLFRFGLPRRMRAQGTETRWDLQLPSKEQLNRDFWCDVASWAAFALITLGSGFQICAGLTPA